MRQEHDTTNERLIVAILALLFAVAFFSALVASALLGLV